jgi:hypothetical protein
MQAIEADLDVPVDVGIAGGIQAVRCRSNQAERQDGAGPLELPQVASHVADHRVPSLLARTITSASLCVARLPAANMRSLSLLARRSLPRCVYTIVLDLVLVFHFGRPVGHGMLARVRRFGRLLQVVPVLNDFSVLEAEHVETDLRTEEIVFGVREDEIAVLENAHRFRLGGAFWKKFEHGDESLDAVAHGEVVLNVFLRVHHRGRSWITGLNAFEQLDNLFLPVARYFPPDQRR